MSLMLLAAPLDTLSIGSVLGLAVAIGLGIFLGNLLSRLLR